MHRWIGKAISPAGTLGKACFASLPPPGHPPPTHDPPAPAAGGVLDPVCGMSFYPHTAKHRTDYRGHTYYFCNPGCRTKFIADPQKYLGPREPEPVVEDAIYTCPM